jgi:hypothetical protein
MRVSKYVLRPALIALLGFEYLCKVLAATVANFLLWYGFANLISLGTPSALGFTFLLIGTLYLDVIILIGIIRMKPLIPSQFQFTSNKLSD